jgi:hypothetical protein
VPTGWHQARRRGQPAPSAGRPGVCAPAAAPAPRAPGQPRHRPGPNHDDGASRWSEPRRWSIAVVRAPASGTGTRARRTTSTTSPTIQAPTPEELHPATWVRRFGVRGSGGLVHAASRWLRSDLSCRIRPAGPCRHRARPRRPPPSALGGTRGTQERTQWHTDRVQQRRRGAGAGIRRTGGTASITGLHDRRAHSARAAPMSSSVWLIRREHPGRGAGGARDAPDRVPAPAGRPR